MEFAGGVVIGVCGGDFVFEVAEVESFAFADDGGAPEFFILIEADTFIAGAGITLFRVPCVLCNGGEAEVCAAVVEAVAVDVVNDVSIGGVYEVLVHQDTGVFS